MEETWIKEGTNEGDQRVDTPWLKEHIYNMQRCLLDLEGVGMKGLVAHYRKVSLTGMWSK